MKNWIFITIVAFTTICLLSACNKLKPAKPLTDKAAKYAQPYVDDAINWAERTIVSNFTKPDIKKIENIIVKREKPSEIFGTDGSILFHRNGNTYATINGLTHLSEQNFITLNERFNKIHSDVLNKTLNHISSYKVYPNEVASVIRKSIIECASVNSEATIVTYNEATNELIITIGINTRKYLIGKTISYSVVATTSGYMALKSDFSLSEKDISFKIPLSTISPTKTVNKKRPVARFEQIWVEYDYYDLTSNTKGMRIHSKFTIKNREKNDCEIAAYFYFENGEVLKDFDNTYKSVDGQVSVGEHFSPDFEDTIYENFVLYIPYAELHLKNGRHDLKFQLSLFSDSGKEIRQSNWQHFYVST